MLIFFDLFYTVKNKKAVKTINYDPYLNEIALAYWAKVDGAWTKAVLSAYS
jgi:hypothetical protein